MTCRLVQQMARIFAWLSQGLMAAYTKKTINRRRSSNMVNQIGSELGLSQEDMDNLFIAAKEIDA